MHHAQNERSSFSGLDQGLDQSLDPRKDSSRRLQPRIHDPRTQDLGSLPKDLRALARVMCTPHLRGLGLREQAVEGRHSVAPVGHMAAAAAQVSLDSSHGDAPFESRALEQDL